MQQLGPERPAMTFDEVSLERSKSFVQALQELKNLRPQLYSAADYCEKAYLHSEQKQMVLDHLKEYAVRALVNAVDHLGTVTYKLTEISEQQSSDISTVELKISCLSQQILTCQTFADKEGLRQQQLSSRTTPRHKKHYILPSPIHKRLENISNLPKDNRSSHVQSMPLPQSYGTLAPKTLSWHLASDNSPAPSKESWTSLLVEDSRDRNVTMNSLPPSEHGAPMSLSSHLQAAKGNGTSVEWKQDEMEAKKSLSEFKSFDKSVRGEISQPPPRSKNIISALFPRNKNFKPKRVPVS
ncbi:probable protein ABIL1 isoform X1 [Zingiber officinale]|uniref:probable protein ABIL1 isoform X1 n=1 Tax=Zingiber officinale TaxID=94328 RepID=UPI001C4C1143|nr:probable protein ABIL1 isoform X1 [Zingiber officinale]